jgi:hypothetical protein
MARGTGRDNVTTQWSVNAIEQRTGISRPNADKAVRDLVDRGVWEKSRGGKHPIYRAVPAHLIPGGPFTTDEEAVLVAIRRCDAVPYEAKASAEALKARGFIRERTNRHSNHKSYKPLEVDDAALAAYSAALPVWLPNTLIDSASGEVPPVELIRQTRSLSALRLLIELYAVQFLPHYGGVPRELLQRGFERVKVGEQGPFVVWGVRSKHTTAGSGLYRPFMTGQQTTRNDGKRADTGMELEFWPALHILENLGFVECVGMLVEAGDGAAEIIHPYGIHGGEPAERQLAIAAQLAAEAMITPGQRDWADGEGYYLVPAPRHIAQATVVEVYRLKYRPHTKATAAWYAEMLKASEKHLRQYEALTHRPAAARA